MMGQHHFENDRHHDEDDQAEGDDHLGEDDEDDLFVDVSFQHDDRRDLHHAHRSQLLRHRRPHHGFSSSDQDVEVFLIHQDVVSLLWTQRLVLFLMLLYLMFLEMCPLVLMEHIAIFTTKSAKP